MMRARVAAAALLIAAAGGVAAQEPAPDKDLQAFFDREFRNAIEESPESGTYLGSRATTTASPTARPRRSRAATRASRSSIAELERFDPAKLSDAGPHLARRDARAAAPRRARDALLRRPPVRSARLLVPVSSMNGPHLTLPFVVKATRFRHRADYDNYLKRLAALPRMLAGRRRSCARACAPAGCRRARRCSRCRRCSTRSPATT
jgi:uncharacterized protein (DUF885 family)